MHQEQVECTDSALEKLMYERRSVSKMLNTDEFIVESNENGESSPNNIVIDDNFFANRDFDIKVPHEEYENYFLRRKMKEILNNSGDCEIPKHDNDDDVVELDSSYESRYWERKPKLYPAFGSDSEEEASYDRFDPCETSSSKFNNGIGPYMFRKFNRKHSRFLCEVHSVESPTIISINPLMEEFTTEFSNIQKSIAEVVNRTPHLDSFKKGQPCLARHEGKWYRGWIESLNKSGLHAKVILVDIMSLQEISREYLKAIPDTLLNIPLRCSRVELSGVQPNGRYRIKLITETLTRILVKDHKNMFAVIINYNSRYPKIKLYMDESCNQLVYHKMIEDQYFSS